MLLCLGSVVWTVASEAHWLVQAETKRQMVVVCVVYCDCDLTALLYLLLEVHVSSCAHACTSKCICVMTEKEMQRPYVHDHQFSLSLSLSGSCWWISSQSKQESKHTDGSACSYSSYQTMLEFNYSSLCFCQIVDGNIVIKQNFNSDRLVFFICAHTN